MATTHDEPQPVWRDPRYADHVRFYESFMKFAQFGVATVIAVLVLMAIFLV